MLGEAASRVDGAGRGGEERVLLLERELAETRARLQDFLDISSDWIWEMDAGLRFTRFGGRLLEVSGIDPARLIGKTRREVMRDPAEAASRRHLDDLDAHRPFRDFIYEAATPLGPRVFKISGKPVFAADGAFRGYRGTGTDVTEEIEARQEAERTLRRFREAIEHISASILLCDAADRLVICNSATERFFPRVAHMLVPGTPFADILRAQAESGFVVGAVGRVEEWLAERMQRHHRGDLDVTRAYADGRWARIIERKTSDGGIIGIRLDITELKRHEEELAQQSALLQAIFDNMTQGVAVYDGALKLAACNKRYAELLDFPEWLVKPGLPFETLMRHNAERGDYGPGDVEALVASRVQQAKDHTPQRFERRRLDGTILEAIRLPMPDGGFLNTFTDITEQRRYEQELARQSALLQATFDTMSDGLAVFDGSLRLVAFNRRYLELLGLPEDLVALGTPFAAIIRHNATRGDYGPGDVESFVESRTRNAQSPTPERFERRRLDGAVLDAARRPMPGGGFLTTFADISDRKRHEHELARQSALLQATLDSISQGLSAYDAELRLVASNQKFLDMLDLPAAFSQPGSRFEDLIRFNAERGEYGPVGDIDALVADRLALVRRPEVHCLERTRDDGTVMELRGHPMPGGGFVTTYTDITARKRSEQELAEHAKELERSNAELEQFAYVASHDLQEPLRMVASYCQLLQRRYKGKLDGDADEFIGYAVEGAGRMQRMINDLLGYSRVGRRAAMTAIHLADPVVGAIANLKAAIDDGAATVDVAELPMVTGDRPLLTQLFQNLIGNALKFRGETPVAVRVSAVREGDLWTVTIADNGIGIAPEYKDKIFLIFQRLHERSKYPGTGIGLAVCKKVVEYHGGRIWVESQPGEGSRFCFTLPAAAGEGGAS
jgi:PAS domain S-box-containing protein